MARERLTLLELGQDEFGVERDDVYDIIAAWHDHAADVEEYVALQEEYGMDAQGIRDALQEAQQTKKDAAEYDALRRDLGMDADGMRKVFPCSHKRAVPAPIYSHIASLPAPTGCAFHR